MKGTASITHKQAARLSRHSPNHEALHTTSCTRPARRTLLATPIPRRGHTWHPAGLCANTPQQPH
jgi:hypothetical protein